MLLGLAAGCSAQPGGGPNFLTPGLDAPGGTACGTGEPGSATCPPGTVCEVSACGAAGACVQLPDDCGAPVLACPGGCFASACDAADAGVSIEHGAACTPSCAADDSTGAGYCGALLGYRFDGSVCMPLQGCECEGLDCDRMTPSLHACELAHDHCG